jgi:hypothetical protein
MALGKCPEGHPSKNNPMKYDHPLHRKAPMKDGPMKDGPPRASGPVILLPLLPPLQAPEQMDR